MEEEMMEKTKDEKPQQLRARAREEQRKRIIGSGGESLSFTE